MSNRSGTSYSAPTDADRRPVALGVSTADGKTPLPLEVDPITGQLQVSSTGGGGGGTQYAEGTATTPGTGNLSLGRYKLTPPSLTDGQMESLQLDSAGNLKVTGSLSVGGTTDNSSFTAGTSTGTPAMGFYHSVLDTVTDGRSAAVAITSKRALMVNLQNSTGTEIGTTSNPVQVTLANTGANATAVKVDNSGVTQPISGTVTVQQSTASSLKVDLSGTGANATAIKVDGSTVTQPVSGTVTTSPPANASTNVAQINGITPLMGNGLTGTGSLRVTVASDNTAFPVNATLSAETTKVIGTINVAASQTIAVTNAGTFATQSTLGAETTKVIGTVRTADGSGNLLTTNSTTFTAKNALDTNLLGTLGTAFSTAGKVDVKGADGDVFVRQATGTNLHTVIDSGTITAVTAITNALPAGTNVIGHVITDTGSLTAATQSGNWTSRVVGNAGATLDATIGPATAPTNMLAVGGVFNSSPPSLTNGQSAALQLDTSGNLKVTGTLTVGGTTDESAFTAATSTGTATMGFYNDTTTSNLTAGQLGIPRLSVNRNQYIQIRDGAGNERGANVNQNSQLSVSVDNIPRVSWDSVNGDPVPTTAKGVAVMSIADNLGDPIGSTNGYLNVYTRGAQDANELAQGGVAYFNSSLSSTISLVKTGRTNLYYLNIVNTNSTNAFVQVYDTTVGNVTVGTTPPTEVWFIPAGGCFEEVFPIPLTYWNAVQIAATTTATGSAAPTTGLVVNLRTTP